MPFYPSVRECLERRKKLEDTPQLIEAAQELAILEPDIARAVDRMRAVWQLVQDMASNLGAGMALPPTPQIGQRKTETSGNTAVQKPPVTEMRAAACPPIPQPEDTYSLEQLLVLLKVSRPKFYAMSQRGEFPRPTVRQGTRKYWLKARVEHLLPQKASS